MGHRIDQQQPAMLAAAEDVAFLAKRDHRCPEFRSGSPDGKSRRIRYAWPSNVRPDLSGREDDSPAGAIPAYRNLVPRLAVRE
jgi:hypothetical protein